MRKRILLWFTLTIIGIVLTTNFSFALYKETPSPLEEGQKAFDSGDYATAIRYYTKTITADPLYSDRDISDALFSRAAAYNNIGHFTKAIADYTRYLQLNPASSDAYTSRGNSYSEKGDYANAIADYKQAISSGPTTQVGTVSTYNNLAWLLATCPLKEFRDGKRAVENANAAWETSMKKSLNVLDTLAAAYAEAGDFPTAIKWEQQFLATPDLKKSESDGAKKRLALYEVGKPYHEKP